MKLENVNNQLKWRKQNPRKTWESNRERNRWSSVAKQQEELERISTISKEEGQEIIMKDMTEQLSKERAIMIKESEQLM